MNSIFNQFMDAIDNKINSDWKFDWSCYGSNAQVSGHTNDYASLEMVYDTETKTVYEITVGSESQAAVSRHYRWVNPAYIQASREEYQARGIEFNDAGNGEKYVMLEVFQDALIKGKAMMANEDFDTRILVPLELEDDLLLALFKAAHNLDITLNQFVEQAVSQVIEAKKAENTSEISDGEAKDIDDTQPE